MSYENNKINRPIVFSTLGKGPKGDKGDKGDAFTYADLSQQQKEEIVSAAVAAGVKGDKGDTGPQGPRGPQGIQGPKGDKGDPGDVSSSQLQEVRQLATHNFWLAKELLYEDEWNNHVKDYAGSLISIGEETNITALNEYHRQYLEFNYVTTILTQGNQEDIDWRNSHIYELSGLDLRLAKSRAFYRNNRFQDYEPQKFLIRTPDKPDGIEVEVEAIWPADLYYGGWRINLISKEEIGWTLEDVQKETYVMGSDYHDYLAYDLSQLEATLTYTQSWSGPRTESKLVYSDFTNGSYVTSVNLFQQNFSLFKNGLHLLAGEDYTITTEIQNDSRVFKLTPTVAPTSNDVYHIQYN